VELDHEMDVQRAELDALDREEVGCQDPACLVAQEPQVGPERRGAGPSPLLRRSLRIAVAETLIPSLASSPRIRMHPHAGSPCPCEGSAPARPWGSAGVP
jgi:hypothetical protein